MLVDDRILVLIKAARRIMEEVSETPGSPRLRVAIAVGPVDVRERGDDPPAIEGGTAVLVASRIEPLVRPGEIWVTDEIRAMLETTDTIFRAEPVTHAPRATDGHVNVKKHGLRGAGHVGQAAPHRVVIRRPRLCRPDEAVRAPHRPPHGRRAALATLSGGPKRTTGND